MSPLKLSHNQYDVVIAGAGPAGTTVALRQPPRTRVLIVDRRKAPWRKPCDGILTPMSLRVLHAISAGDLKSANPIDASMLRVVDRDNGRVEVVPLQDHRMVDREAFDTGLRAHLRSHPGTEFLDEAAIVDWTECESGLRLRLRRCGCISEIRTGVFVDASGAAGLAREWSGNPLPRALAVQLWYPPQGEPQRCEWIFERAETPYYLWAIRKPLGMVLGGLFPLTQAYAARTLIEGRLAKRAGVEGKPWRVQAAPMVLPEHREDVQLRVGPVLAVGEAAGLINAGTGEGISFALRSGFACGNAIALSQGQTRAAADLYEEFARPLVDETLTKAQHARRLFHAGQRRELGLDDILVPVPHTSLQGAAI